MFVIDNSRFLNYAYSMIKTHKKIEKLMKDAGITLRNLYERQNDLFPKEECLSFNAYRKIINGESSPRFSTLLKICQLLEVSLLELIEDTELDDAFLMRNKNRVDSFTYNTKAYAEILTSPACRYMTMELTLEPGGKTSPERSPDDKKYEKFIYVMAGRLKLTIDNEEYNLLRKDGMTFNSSKEHYFENIHSRNCVCLVTISPKHL